MKICIIGNSHVGAIKRGWDEVKLEFESIDVCFYCARGNGLNSLYVNDDGFLVTDDLTVRESLIYTSKQDGMIKPNDYDVVFIYGLGLKAQSISPDMFYTKNFLDDFTRRPLLLSLNYKVMNMVKSIFDKPIYIGSNPLPPLGDNSCGSKKSSYIHWVNYLHVEYGDLFKLIPQSEKTITNGCFTMSHYSEGSKKIQLNHNEDKEFKGDNLFHNKLDLEHMNDEYGALYMRDIIMEIIQND